MTPGAGRSAEQPPSTRATAAEVRGATRERRPNRGPSAAAGNRAALLAAARTAFAVHGLNTPLAQIARTAGVGQGSLYRHFPDRRSLALAVFEDNIAEIESLVAAPESTLEQVLRGMVAQLVEAVALIDLIGVGSGGSELSTLGDRTAELLAAKLETAKSEGLVHADITGDDLLLALGMAAAALSRTRVEERASVGERALKLLWRGISDS